MGPDRAPVTGASPPANSPAASAAVHLGASPDTCQQHWRPVRGRRFPDDARMLRLAFAVLAVQAGFHAFTASLPVALAQAGVPDIQIGLIVGTAALVQIPAAFVAGVVVDRVGGLRAFTAGGLAYLVGCVILLLPGVEPGGPSGRSSSPGSSRASASRRCCRPRCRSCRGSSRRRRRGFGLAFVGSAHNLTLVVIPPLSLAVLARPRSMGSP